jgi:6-phosphogluconolactonase
LKPAAIAKLITPAKSGPRHIVFHPAKDNAFVDDEQGKSVTAYQFDGKKETLQPFQTLTTLPADFSGINA